MNLNRQTKHILKWIGFVASIAGTLLSALLICKHVFPELCTSSFGCTLSPAGGDGCSNLGKSDYSKLFGIIPTAIPGTFYYLLLTFLFVSLLKKGDDEKEKGILMLISSLAIFGTLFDVFLAYINFFKLIVPCTICAYTYPMTLIVAVVAIILYIKTPEMKMENLQMYKQIAKQSLIPISSAVAATALILILFMLIASDSSAEEEGRIKVASESELRSTLSEFKTLRDADLSTENIPAFTGEKSAYILIHDFADFNCGHCFHMSELLQEADQRWPGRIGIYYRHFPLDGTCNPLVQRKVPGAPSCLGAVAEICAQEQGLGSKLYHRLFRFQLERKLIDASNLKSAVNEAGGNFASIQACISKPSTIAKLNRDIKDAELLNIEATPTLVIDGKLMTSGVPDKNYFFKLLDALVFNKEGKPALDELKARERGK